MASTTELRNKLITAALSPIQTDGVRRFVTNDDVQVKCELTGRVIKFSDVVLDHKVSVKHGGSGSIENVQFVCEEINRMKGTMDQDEFIRVCREVVAHADEKDSKAAPEGHFLVWPNEDSSWG